MNKPTSSSDGAINIALTMLVNLVVLFFSIQRWVELKVALWRSVWLIPCLLYILVIIICLALLLQWGSLSSLVEKYQARFRRGMSIPFFDSLATRSLWFGLAGLVILLIPWLKFSLRVGEVIKKSTQDPILTTILFYWLVWWLLLLGSWLIMAALRTSWRRGFAFFLVLAGVVYESYNRLQGVSAYPFSLSWSETSRYYYASLLFSENLYGTPFPLSILHPSRYLLQSLPFLFSGGDVFASRLWQAMLWIILTAITAIVLPWKALARNHKYQNDWLLKFVVSGAIFLFLLRVGVYYHLQPIVFIPLLLTSPKNDLRSMIGLILASAWAGISRINWFPVPALIYALIYLFQMPVSSKKNLLHYFGKPALYFLVGSATAVLAQQAYIIFSGNTSNAEAFSSSFTSSLIWSRLLPNESYPMGVVLGILLISSPILFHFLLALIKLAGRIHPMRILGLVFILLVFFIGGLVVSVKIGGGADLHNMDAFAIMLALACLLSASGDAVPESGDKVGQPSLNWPVVVFGLLLPIIFLIPILKPIADFDPKKDQKSLDILKNLVETSAERGEVLFINERHLVTFGKIKVPMVYDYEAVTLMEMAMSGNQEYLQTFYNKLKQHEFSAIVSGRLNTGLKTEGLFFEENNVWNSRVSQQILCYYQPAVLQTRPELSTVLEAEASKITVLVPKESDGVCP